MNLSTILRALTLFFAARAVSGFSPAAAVRASALSACSSLHASVPADIWDQLLPDKQEENRRNSSRMEKTQGDSGSNEMNVDKMLMQANGVLLSILFLLAAFHPTQVVSTVDTAVVQMADKSADLFVF